MSYNKEIDYQSKINDAVANGDYKSAAKYEQSRNEKIDSEGLNYEKTNRYSGWLDSTDYSNVLKKQMSSGASKSSVSDTLKKRISKASGTDGLTQYAYDDVTGLFQTVAGVITVPAATYTQDPITGQWNITPGVTVLTVTGTV